MKTISAMAGAVKLFPGSAGAYAILPLAGHTQEWVDLHKFLV
jgi:hypothetical protein